MSLLWSVFFVMIAAIVQSVLPVVGEFHFLRLPLVSVVVVYSMLMLSFRRAVFLSLFAGFIKDSLDIGPLGGWMFSFLILTLLFNRYREKVFGGSIIAQALFGCLGCGISAFLFGIICLIMRSTYLSFARIAEESLISAAFGLVLVPLCSILFFEPLARHRNIKRGRL